MGGDCFVIACSTLGFVTCRIAIGANSIIRVAKVFTGDETHIESTKIHIYSL
jgi:hypothetical protein